MNWDYLGNRWREVAYFYFRSWGCDKLHIKCPSCADAERKDAETKDMTNEEFAEWLDR